MYNGNLDTLHKLIQINKSLDDINIFNNNKQNKRYSYNLNNSSLILSDNNNLMDINSNINTFHNIINQNKLTESNSPLEQIININKRIDSVYDSMQLMKSSNKINSKVLYLVNHSSQTYEDY